MSTTARAILAGVAATLTLGVGVALPAVSAHASACPDYTWKWKGGPPSDGAFNG